MIIVSNLPVESRQAAQAAEQEHGGAVGRRPGLRALRPAASPWGNPI